MVIIILGSKSDLDWGKEIGKHLTKFSMPYQIHIGSAHKTPQHLLDIIKRYDANNSLHVYICVAGRSNALGGFIDAQTSFPVINCPPYNEKFAGLDILSSLRMPSGVAPATILEPEQAALFAVKILGLKDLKLKRKILNYQKNLKNKILSDGKNLSNDLN